MKNLAIRLTLLVYLAFAGAAHAVEPLSAPIGQVIPSIGDGYDIINDEVRGRCIQFSSTDVQSIGNSQDKLYAYAFNSSESFEKLLSVSGNASGGLGLFHASFAASYLEQAKASRYANYLLIRVDVTKAADKLLSTAIRLSEAAKSAASDPGSFLAKCGNAVVVQTQAGASFLALYRFETSSTQAQQSLQTSLEAAYGPVGSGQVNTDFQQAVQSTKARTELTMERKGVTGPLPNQDPNAIKTYALNFPQLAKQEQGGITSIAVFPYGVVIGGGGSPRIDENAINAVIEKIDALASIYETVLKLRGDLAYVRAHPSEFSPGAQPQAADFALLETMTARIKVMADNCARGNGVCDPSQIRLPEIRSPDRATWVQVDVTALNGSTIGTVPDGSNRVLEVRGRWNCRKEGPACWFDASNSTSYRVRRVSDGTIVQQGPVSTGTVVITHGGRVEVLVNDGPGVPEFADNEFDTQHPVEATMW